MSSCRFCDLFGFSDLGQRRPQMFEATVRQHFPDGELSRYHGQTTVVGMVINLRIGILTEVRAQTVLICLWSMGFGKWGTRKTRNTFSSPSGSLQICSPDCPALPTRGADSQRARIAFPGLHEAGGSHWLRGFPLNPTLRSSRLATGTL